MRLSVTQADPKVRSVSQNSLATECGFERAKSLLANLADLIPPHLSKAFSLWSCLARIQSHFLFSNHSWSRCERPKEEFIYQRVHQRKQLVYFGPNMNSISKMGCQDDSPFHHCLSMETVEILDRNMVCSYCCNFMVDMDKTMVDKIVTDSLDRKDKLIASKSNSCYKCEDFLHWSNCWWCC